MIALKKIADNAAVEVLRHKERSIDNDASFRVKNMHHLIHNQ
jgi:hypothetical protein